MIAYFLASVLWALTSFLANLLISLFAFAFSLDLVNGSDATGGAGALGPVSQAIHALYASVFGAPWLVLAVAVAGIWAMWKALVQRRYAETAGALGLSLIYVVAALFFVAQPGQTIGAASKWTNRMSVAFLSVSSPRQRLGRGAGQGRRRPAALRPARLQALGGSGVRRPRALRAGEQRLRRLRPRIGRRAAALLRPRPRRLARPPPRRPAKR